MLKRVTIRIDFMVNFHGQFHDFFGDDMALFRRVLGEILITSSAILNHISDKIVACLYNYNVLQFSLGQMR